MPTYTAVAGGGNWNVPATWTGGTSGGVPTTGDTAILNATSGQVTVTADAICLILDCTGYANTLTINTGFSLRVTGTGATISLGGTISTAQQGVLSTIGTNTAVTIIFNGVTIPRLNCGISTGGTQTITVSGTTPTIGNLNVSNISTVSLAGTALNINQSLSVTGNLIGTAFNITGGGTVSITCVSPQVSTIRNGFTVTTGTTLSMSTSLEINGGIITFDANSFLTTNSNTLRLQGANAITLNTSVVTWFNINNLQSSTTTLTSDLNVSNNFIIDSLSGFSMVGSGGTRNINCTGGFSQQSAVTFTTTSITVNLTGTGIWDAQVSSIISNGVFVINTSNPSGYTIGSASRNIHYFLNSTITLIGSSVVNVLSGHTLRIQGTCTLSTNNTGSGGTQIIWRNLTFASFPNAGILVLNNDTIFTGNVTGTNSSTATINGSKILVEGNLDAFGALGTIGGTSTLEFSGSSNSNWLTGIYQNNIILNKSSGATVTTTGAVTWGIVGRTLNLITGNNLVLSNILKVAGGTFTAVGSVTGSANLELAATCTLDIATGVTIPNLRANSAAAITVTLSRTTVVTNFSKTGTGASACTFSASTAGTELRITNYTLHAFNLGQTIMDTNTTLRFMGSCSFNGFIIAGNVVLDTGATLTPLFNSSVTLQNNPGMADIGIAGNTTLNFSAGTLVIPAFSATNRLGVGISFVAGTTHTINMGSNSIDWVSCTNGPTVTLQSNLVINKAITQGASTPTFTGGFNLIVKESLGTVQTAAYSLNLSGGTKIVYQSSPTGFIGTGYISGTTLFITSVTQGSLGYFSMVHVPSSTSTTFTQITNCATGNFNSQYSLGTSMTVGSVGSPVTIYGFGVGQLGTNGLLEIDAGSNDVYFQLLGLSSTAELRYLSTNSGIFNGSKATVLANSTVGGIVDFQNQSSPSKLINTFSPGFNSFGNLVLKSDLYVNDFNCANSSGLTQTGGTYSLYVLRNATISNDASVVARTITPTVRFEGPLNGTLTFLNVYANMVVNKSVGAILTVAQSFNYGYATATTFTYTAGQVNFGATTMTITGSCTIISPSSVGNFSFNNVTIGSGFTLTLQNTMRILGILLCNGNATFTGTHGWTTNTFTCLATGSTITLQNSNASPNAIYYISIALNLTGASSASRILLQASGSATFNARAGSPSANSLQVVSVTSGTVQVGMTVSQATGQSPLGFSNLLPTRPVINGGSSPNFTLDQTIVPSVPNPPTGTISMRAGYKAIFTLQSGAFQNVIYVTTQDIDSLSNSGATILSFGSNNDDVATDVFLYRTLNWGPLLPSFGSAYRTWVD